MLVALGAKVLKFFRQVGKIFGTKICDKNILFGRIFWCLILLQEFFSRLFFWEKKNRNSTKIGTDRLTNFYPISSVKFFWKKCLNILYAKFMNLKFYLKNSLRQILQKSLWKSFAIFIKSNSSVKHSTLEFCSWNFCVKICCEKKNRTCAKFATVQFLVLKFLTDLWIKHLGPNGWYKNFL